LRHSSSAGLELLPISGSIPRSSNTPSEETGVYFKTCCLRRYLSPGSKVRRNEAICLGSDYLDRNISYGPSLHRTLRKRFTQELLLLDSIAERVRSFPGLGYTLKRSRLREVEKSLAKVRKLAFHCLGDSKIQIPSTPEWGNAGDSDRIWNPNDFEILMTCFYEEVESYLSHLGSHLPEEVAEKRESQPLIPRDKSRTFLSSQLIKEETDQEPKTEEEAFVPSRRSAREIPSHLSSHVASTAIDPVKPNKDRKRVSMHFPDYCRGLAELSTVPEFASAGLTMHHQQTSVTPLRRKDNLSSRKEPSLRRMKDPPGHPGDSDGDSRDNSDSAGNRLHESLAPRGPVPPGLSPPVVSSFSQGIVPVGLFDTKLKVSDIPEWDGDPDTLAKWIKKVSHFAERSPHMFEQLGSVVPQRLTKSAETWYWSLPEYLRKRVETNWQTLRDHIKSYYMNRSWLDKQKTRANNATYRDVANPEETPSEYYIRKYELLTLVYNLSESELIMEIMNGAPSSWINILNPNLYDDLAGFQGAIKYHEDYLMRMDDHRGLLENERYIFSGKDPPSSPRPHLVGSTDKLTSDDE
jgi:hypothetical protein